MPLEARRRRRPPQTRRANLRRRPVAHGDRAAAHLRNPAPVPARISRAYWACALLPAGPVHVALAARAMLARAP
eukprot:1951272-Lingulodinium_polyedra.AAC.1